MIFTFGERLLDTGTFELRQAGHAVNIEPQVFDVLALLVTHRDRVVTKEELLDEVWGNRFVSESALTSRIKDARRAVGDDGHRQAVIRTVHGRGYRFVAPVAEVGAAGEAPGPAGTPAPGTGTGTPPPRPPRTRYARSGRYTIAYQVLGSGPGDLVFIPGFVSNIELQWEFPAMATFFDRLASRARLIVFDKRGTGLSDRVPVDEIPALEERMDDVRAVMDAAGSERATLFGISEGGPLALLFAATYPERVERLVLFNSYAHRFREDIPALAIATRDAWGNGGTFGTLAPSWRDRDTVRFLARYERHCATPDAAAHLVALCEHIDVRPILPSIAAPVLVIHRRGDMMFPLAKGRELAACIPGAEFLVLEGADHLVYVDQEPVLAAVEAFTSRGAAPREPDRVLTTVVFADIPGPTDLAQPDGDDGPARATRRLREAAGGELARFQGRQRSTSDVPATGAGLLATFDGPARAVRFGQSLQRTASAMGLPLRLGVHTTEVERVGDAVAGIGVQIGAGVTAAATPGEVWVTRTVRDLVAGSGLRFEPRGARQLPGIGEPWPVYAAISPATDEPTLGSP